MDSNNPDKRKKKTKRGKGSVMATGRRSPDKIHTRYQGIKLYKELNTELNNDYDNIVFCMRLIQLLYFLKNQDQIQNIDLDKLNNFVNNLYKCNKLYLKNSNNYNNTFFSVTLDEIIKYSSAIINDINDILFENFSIGPNPEDIIVAKPPNPLIDFVLDDIDNLATEVSKTNKSKRNLPATPIDLLSNKTDRSRLTRKSNLTNKTSSKGKRKQSKESVFSKGQPLNLDELEDYVKDLDLDI